MMQGWTVKASDTRPAAGAIAGPNPTWRRGSSTTADPNPTIASALAYNSPFDSADRAGGGCTLKFCSRSLLSNNAEG